MSYSYLGVPEILFEKLSNLIQLGSYFSSNVIGSISIAYKSNYLFSGSTNITFVDGKFI